MKNSASAVGDLLEGWTAVSAQRFTGKEFVGIAMEAVAADALLWVAVPGSVVTMTCETVPYGGMAISPSVAAPVRGEPTPNRGSVVTAGNPTPYPIIGVSLNNGVGVGGGDCSVLLQGPCFDPSAYQIKTLVNKTVNYTLALGDTGKVFDMKLGTALVLTVPPNSSVAFTIGTILEVVRLGAGSVTITPGAGVTIPNRLEAAGTTSRTISAQYGVVRPRKRATDQWVIEGDLA